MLLRHQLEIDASDRASRKRLCECELKLGNLGSVTGRPAEAIAYLRDALEDRAAPATG